MKTLLLNLFGSFSLSGIWNKVKIALLVGAISFMFWQGLQMTSLQKDVSNLETVQISLQEQVRQVEANYKTLQTNYNQSAKTGEQYFDSLNHLATKSTELEKAFAALEASRGTTPREIHEKRPTAAQRAPEQGFGTTADGNDAEWRKLLDNTFCEVHPTNSRCPK